MRVLALLFLGAGLFQFSLTALGLVWLFLIAATAYRGHEALSGLRRALRRIRWLLLSIALIYLWIAPEADTGGGWLPSMTDTLLALRRVGILVVLVTAVELLRQTTRAEYTAAAIAALISPLRWLGIETQRFARRMALTLEAVPVASEVVGRAAGDTTIKKRSLAGWGAAAARLIRDIETRGLAGTGGIQLPVLGYPRASDWLVLTLVVAASVALAWL